MTDDQLQLAVYRLITNPEQYHNLWDAFTVKYGKTPVDWVKEKVAKNELALP